MQKSRRNLAEISIILASSPFLTAARYPAMVAARRLTRWWRPRSASGRKETPPPLRTSRNLPGEAGGVNADGLSTWRRSADASS